MTAYEKQIQETEQHYDQMMSVLEDEDIEVLYSSVAGSRLHDIINNPVTEGIDEG